MATHREADGHEIPSRSLVPSIAAWSFQPAGRVVRPHRVAVVVDRRAEVRGGARRRAQLVAAVGRVHQGPSPGDGPGRERRWGHAHRAGEDEYDRESLHRAWARL